MLLALTTVASELMLYLLHPRAAFAHLVAGALLYDIFRMHGARVAGVVGALEEAVILLLWLVIPNSWATILSLALAIHVYEKLIGPRIEIVPDAVLYSGQSRAPARQYPAN